MSGDASDLTRSTLSATQPSLVSPVSPGALAHAYDVARATTASHSRSILLASRLISPDKRPAIWALYAFSRTVDNAVDHAAENGAEKTAQTLAHWRQVTLSGLALADDPLGMAWADTLARYAIPKQYALDLINGVARDTEQMRYTSFSDLESYCYGVASTVGLMMMHIIGYSGPEAIPYAVKLGQALQMTNILRDIRPDWELGRLYLPLEDLAAFDLSERDIDRGVVTDNWRRFMDFQIARTRHLYTQAWPGIRILDGSGRLAIAVAVMFYRNILDQIERNDYDVFSRRIHFSKWRKLYQLPRLWWQTRD